MNSDPSVLKAHSLAQDDGNGNDIYSSCQIADDGTLQCSTAEDVQFELCRGLDTNALRLRLGSGVPAGCEVVTLIVVNEQF